MSKIKRIALVIIVMSIGCFSPFVTQAIGFFRQEITIPLVELKVPKITEFGDDSLTTSSESIETKPSISDEGFEVEESIDR